MVEMMSLDQLVYVISDEERQPVIFRFGYNFQLLEVIYHAINKGYFVVFDTDLIFLDYLN